MTFVPPDQASGSALLAGVLSSCFAKKKVAKEEGDPRGGAGFAGSLRYSAGRAAAELGLRPQTVLADCPRPSCVAQRLPRGPQRRPCLTDVAQKTGFHGQPEKTSKNEIFHSGTQAKTRIVLPGPLRGAEQRRGWRKRGEDCLRAKPEFRSPRQSRVAQGTGVAGTDPGVAFFFGYFLLGEARRKYARQQGGTPSLHSERGSNSEPRSAWRAPKP
jgi:hypothetical protein